MNTIKLKLRTKVLNHQCSRSRKA